MVFLLSKGVGAPVLQKGFKPIRREADAYYIGEYGTLVRAA